MISTQKQSNFTQTCKDLITGSLVGMTSVVLFQPLNVVKLRLQVQNSYRGIQDCFQSILKNEGIKALYKGTLTPLFGVGFMYIVFFFQNCVFYKFSLNAKHYKKRYSLMFGINESLKRFSINNFSKQNGNLPLSICYFNGMITGFLVSFVAHPFDLIRTKLQISQQKLKYKGSLDVIKQSYRHFGIRGLYQGGICGFTCNSLGNGLYFATYECVKNKIQNQSSSIHKKNNKLVSLIGGPLAGIISISVIFPIDSIKCKLQADNLLEPCYKNMKQCLQQTLKSGYRSLYRGFTVSLTRAPLNSFVAFYAFEKIKAFMDKI